MPLFLDSSPGKGYFFHFSTSFALLRLLLLIFFPVFSAKTASLHMMASKFKLK